MRMSDVVPLDEALTKYRKLISIQKEQLKKIHRQFSDLANHQEDEFKKVMADRISQNAQLWKTCIRISK